MKNTIPAVKVTHGKGWHNLLNTMHDRLWCRAYPGFTDIAYCTKPLGDYGQITEWHHKLRIDLTKERLVVQIQGPGDPGNDGGPSNWWGFDFEKYPAVAEFAKALDAGVREKDLTATLGDKEWLDGFRAALRAAWEDWLAPVPTMNYSDLRNEALATAETQRILCREVWAEYPDGSNGYVPIRPGPDGTVHAYPSAGMEVLPAAEVAASLMWDAPVFNYVKHCPVAKGRKTPVQMEGAVENGEYYFKVTVGGVVAARYIIDKRHNTDWVVTIGGGLHNFGSMRFETLIVDLLQRARKKLVKVLYPQLAAGLWSEWGVAILDPFRETHRKT